MIYRYLAVILNDWAILYQVTSVWTRTTEENLKFVLNIINFVSDFAAENTKVWTHDFLRRVELHTKNFVLLLSFLFISIVRDHLNIT